MNNNYNKETTTTGGITFIGALQIAFIVLKLCKIIDWSWFWVFAPIWIPVCFWIVLIVIAIIIASLCK